MKITGTWLENKNACNEGKEWFLQQEETNGLKVVKKLLAEEKLDWASWLIVRVMKRKQHLAYAIFAAEQVLDIFEKKYPEDKRPRQAIEAAKLVLKKDTKETRDAANAAYAASAAYAAYATYAAVAAYATAAAAAAAYATYAAAAYAAYAAASAADARKEMQLKILNYGIEILEKGVGK